MKKRITHMEEARRKLLKGVELVTDTVKVTLGAKGKNVLLAREWGPPLITNDGVTIAREIEAEDWEEHSAVLVVKEAAGLTNDVAGDGTTTACILTSEIFKQGAKYVVGGFSPIDIKRGIDYAVDIACESLDSHSMQVKGDLDKLENVAAISGNNDHEMGKLIRKCFEKVGVDGVITVDAGKSTETTVETVDGMQLDRGFASPYFINEDGSRVYYNNAYVLLWDGAINSVAALLPLLKAVSDQEKPLLIMADGYSTEVMSTLVVNKIRGSLKICAIKSPGYGERRHTILNDVAILTGGRYLKKELGLELAEISAEMLGTATIKCDKNKIIITDGGGDKQDVADRVSEIEKDISASTSEWDREQNAQRKARLTSGVAVIRVGGVTETEVQERRLRLEDALAATKAAAAEGIVPGGGMALANILKFDNIKEKIENKYQGAEENMQLLSQKMGALALFSALKKPLYQIIENAGVEGEEVSSLLSEHSKTNYWDGYDVNICKIVNMLETGIVDPVLVTKTALKNAASAAGMLLTTCATVASPPKSDREAVSDNV